MLTENRADFRTQDWFLIACDGDLVLKLAQDLMIGEDERGQTVLSPAREEALVRVTSEHGCLSLQTLAMDWTFIEDGGLSVQHLSFVEGATLKLVFPNSSLLITPDFQAGARASVDREIRLTPTDTPTLSLSRVDEPIILVEQALLPAPDAAGVEADGADPLSEHGVVIEEAVEQARAAEALTRWEHQIPDERIVEPEARQPEIPVRSPPLQTPAVLAATDRTTRNRVVAAPAATSTVTPAKAPVAPSAPAHSRHRPLAGLIAAAALLAPMCVFMADSSSLGIDFPLSQYRPLSESSPQPVQNGPAQTGASSPAQQPHAQPHPLAETPPAVIPAPPRELPAEHPERSERETLLIASLLAEAKAYYQAGNIVTPVEANAVNSLTQLLSIDPGNEEGLKLMYMSAVTLIEEAEAAHAAGNEYLARNLVEDVLGFHPEFDDARALLDSWARRP